MQRLILLLLAFHSVPALGQYQYYGAPNDGMGAMSSMPPAPPPVSAPPTYPGYGSDMNYGSPGYPSDASFNASSAPNILSYGFLEGGYQYQQPKDSSLEGSHGVALALSVQLFKPLFIKAEFFNSYHFPIKTFKSNFCFIIIKICIIIQSFIFS